MTAISVLAGPARCGKTSSLLERYRCALREGPIGAALWVAPNRGGVEAVRQRLLDNQLTACFRPGITTFAHFADAVVQHASARIRPLSSALQRQLLRRLIDEAVESQRLNYFTPIADTQGFLDEVVGFIQEVKRLEIWPEDFRAACQQRGWLPQDRDLAGVYEQYQELLTRHQLYDPQGRFWEARRLLRDGQRRPFEQLQLVVVDGFTDFTRTEHEILEILAERVRELHISVPLEQGDERADLFAKPRRTLEELRRRHRNLQVEWLDRDPQPNWPALDHIERRLFGHPRRAAAAVETGGIAILAAARQEGEIEWIARIIKRLLTSGDHGDATIDPAQPATTVAPRPVSPDEVLVVFRSLEAVSPLVRQVFGELAIPSALESPRRWHECGLLVALKNLIRLSVEDWPFAQLLSVLGNNYFQPTWREYGDGQPQAARETLAVTQRLIRELQVPSGSQRVIDRLARRATPHSDEGATSPETPAPEQRRRKTQQALALLQRLQATLAQLPQRAAPAQWSVALAELAKELGLLPPETAEVAGFDELGVWKAFHAALRDAQRLADLFGQSAPTWTQADLLAAIEEWLSIESVPEMREEASSVRVVSAQSARAMSAPYVFIGGLAEKSFPPADREDGLYGEAEYRGLIASGLDFADRTRRSQDEMLLFYEVLTRPTSKLFLSYPALDEKAQPHTPSPYLDEVEQCCGPGRIRRFIAQDLMPTAHIEELLGPADFRLRAVQIAQQNEASTRSPRTTDHGPRTTSLLAGLLRADPNMAENLLASLAASEARQSGQGYGAWEGVLAGSAAQREVARLYGADHCWSASRLEQYGSCPFRFFAERVLGLSPLPDLALTTDPMARGTLLHEVLSGLHRRLNEQHGGPSRVTEHDEAAYQRFFEETVGACIARLQTDDPARAALVSVAQRTALDWGTRFYQQSKDYDAGSAGFDQPLAPAHFEVAFGPDAGEVSIDPLSVTAAYALQAEGESVLLAGRIDRIDVGRVAGQNVFNVLDFKSGRIGKLIPDSDEPVAHLQLPLYALVAQELLLAAQEAVPWQIGYWQVHERGPKTVPANSLAGRTIEPDEQWRLLKERVVGRVVALVRSIRSGQFPMHSLDEGCTSFCDFSTICRVQQARALEKQWQPPSKA